MELSGTLYMDTTPRETRSNWELPPDSFFFIADCSSHVVYLWREIS